MSRRCWAGCAVILGLLAAAPWAMAEPRETVQLLSVSSNGVQNSPANSVRTAQLTGGYALGRIALTGTLTRVHANTWKTDSRIVITAPSGEAVMLQPFTAGSTYTSLAVDASTFMPASSAVAGTWTFRFYEVVDDGGTGTVDARWDLTVTFTDDPPVPPLAEDLGSIDGSGVRTYAYAIEPGQVRWLKFTVPCGVSAARGWYLDVDTAGSVIDVQSGGGTFVNDTQLALYDSTGRLIAQDDDGGDGFVAQLSFGRGSGIAPTPGLDGEGFVGSDGRLLSGTYYLAVGTYRMIVGSERWVLTPTGTQSGTVSLTLRSTLPAAGTPCPCPADFNGVGGVGLQDLFDYLTAWFSGSDDGDFNSIDGVTVGDLFDFLAAWFAGCP